MSKTKWRKNGTARRYREDDLQMAVARYLDMMRVDWFHVANERLTSVRSGVRLKKKGVKSGVPDVVIITPSQGYNGLVIELKIKPNRVTESQKEWLKKFQDNNWLTAVCYDMYEVEGTVRKYLNLE